MASLTSASAPQTGEFPTIVLRHSALVRVCHWINALCFLILLMSGLQIFNAHPSLSWGAATDFEHPFLSFSAREDDSGDVAGGLTDAVRPILRHHRPFRRIARARRRDGGARLPVLGDPAGGTGSGDGPALALLLRLDPRRSTACVYAANLVAARHLRDLWPSLADLRAIPRTVRDHALLRFPKGEEALHYNVLQKLAYLERRRRLCRSSSWRA